MRYSIKDFKREYPDDDACLLSVLQNRYGDTCPRCGVIGTRFYRITGRKGFSCLNCKKHIYPLSDTIFRKSETSLWNWFYAIYQFSVSKNGVSAKELERTLSVTYKTAWRMCREIRKLMDEEGDKLTGIVEADETYFGGKATSKARWDNKSAVIGAVERHGRVNAKVLDGANASTALPFLRATLAHDAILHTDESVIYYRVKREFEHKTVNHSKGVYSKNGVTTNSIEGFWGQLKRSIDGTYHCVSPKYLQYYVNEFVFRYNYRDVAIAPVLLGLASKHV